MRAPVLSSRGQNNAVRTNHPPRATRRVIFPLQQYCAMIREETSETMAGGAGRMPRGDDTSPSEAGKTVNETAVVMSRIMQPPDANSFGNVHGGALMRL